MDELQKKIESFLESEEENMLRAIERLIRIPSERGEAADMAPFGPGPKEALEEALKLAEELGLHTRNCEGYLGWAEIGERKGPYLASVTHVDVVPAGDGWSGDPYTLRRREGGFLQGRGVMDDKGPTVICLYLLKFLKDNGFSLRYPFRALIGTNEESGMGDVKYYGEHYEMPLFCFSPDAAFPLIHGEKGIAQGYIRSVCRADSIVRLHAGLAVNVIPGSAELWLRSEKEPQPTERVSVEKDGGLWHLAARGKGGHASAPAGTVNAVFLLQQLLLEQQLVSAEEEAFLRFACRLQAAPDGSLVGAAAKDERFSPLTLVSGMFSLEEGHLQMSLDCRYPAATSAEKIAAALEAASEGSAEVVITRDSKPFYKDASSPELRCCLDAYRAVTGDPSPSYTVGYGTYAKCFPNAAAFGAGTALPHYPPFFGRAHGADETASWQVLKDAFRVYVLTVLKLQELDFTDAHT